MLPSLQLPSLVWFNQNSFWLFVQITEHVSSNETQSTMTAGPKETQQTSLGNKQFIAEHQDHHW